MDMCTGRYRRYFTSQESWEEYKVSKAESSFESFIFYVKNGYKPIQFYKDKELCVCDICKNSYITWTCLEDYAEKYINVYMGDLIDEELVEEMIYMSYNSLDKYRKIIFPREVSPEELSLWYLGLFSENYFKQLPEDLKIICADFMNGRPLIKDEVIIAYIFEAHKGYCAGCAEERDYFTL